MGTPATPEAEAEAEAQEEAQDEAAAAEQQEAEAEAEAEAQEAEREQAQAAQNALTTSSHVSEEVERVLRLQGQTINALFQRVEQLMGNMLAATERMDEATERMMATCDLTEREIGRADELVARVGKATAALTELHQRQARREAQAEAARQAPS